MNSSATGKLPILVTGGTGKTGRRVAAALTERGYAPGSRPAADRGAFAIYQTSGVGNNPAINPRALVAGLGTLNNACGDRYAGDGAATRGTSIGGSTSPSCRVASKGSD